MDDTTLDLLTRLAHALACQFGSNCEVVVHSLSAQDAEHTIAVIENGHVSCRERGGGPSQVVLEAMREHQGPPPQDQSGYLMKTRDGRILKCSTVYVRDGAGKTTGVLSVNYDLTELLMAQRAVDSLINQATAVEAPPAMATNVNELLDDLIAQSVALVGKPVAMMSKEDKIRAIHFLNDAGAFLITKSGDKVTKYFGISKFTLYTYIDAKIEDKENSVESKE